MMKKGFLKRCGALSLILVLILSLAACGSSDTADETSADAEESSESAEAQADETAAEYKYGTIDLPVLDGSLCWAPAYIAYHLGYFAEEGFDVNLATSSIEANKIALNEGTVPVIFGDFQYFPSIENGVEISVVAGIHEGCISIVVNPDSDIETAEDLIGATIAIDEVGGTTHMAASMWLELNGVSASESDGEVSFVPYTDGNLELEALYSGEVDAAVVWDPYGTTSSEAGNTRVILDISTDEPFAGKYCCFVYASNKVLEEDPEQVAAILRALNKAQEYILENPEETVSILMENNYIELDDADLGENLLATYNYVCVDEDMTEEANADVKENIEYFAEQLYNIGYLTTDAQTFVSQAYAEVDLTLGE